ncbi:FAD-binding protein [Streptomyces sp. H27-D2]|uniref:FAD-binding protein n=1 Tax=Streptomyces sp. H27-D2 TaxID=3046304 RepID=UPI002DB97046|nr:FAD-binding protein [Streptomyces sp. H27-D2]MEC4019679.1 FAD-binding protein [Streptomyces sp. H27-D2]
MNSSALSRRKVLGGMAAAVVGWSAATQSWATAAEVTGGATVAALPPLDGQLETSPASVASFSKDFGNLVTATPWAVLRPGSVQDIVKMVNYARANALKIAMNGRSGTGTDLESHSCYGQAAVPGGISIDARGLSKVCSISSTSAVVEAGVTWAQLTDAALAQDKTPPALTDYLHLSVGGTLSVGGVGGTVQKYGLQVDTVQSVDVVTGDGQLVTASSSTRPDLFNAVLAGGGQAGIIVRAKIKLIPAPARALVFSLFYNDLATYLADQEKLLTDGRFGGQVGEMPRRPDDSGWRYKLEAVAYYSSAKAPDRAALLAGLRDDRASAVIEDFTYRDYTFRLDAFEAYLKEGDYWGQPKPWLSLFLPASRTKAFMDQVAAELTPGDLGGGFLLVYPYRTSKLTRPLAVQPNESVGYLFDLLRFPAPGATDIQRMLDQNRRLYDKAVALGAKRYLVGAIPGMTPAEWKQHFGSRWEAFVNAKRRYDPANILTPGQGFFS